MATLLPIQDLASRIDTIRGLIESRLSEIIPSKTTWPVRLHEAQRHALLSPGKRFRPLLCVFIAQGGGIKDGADLDAAITTGCVAEMVHTASLILDDLPCCLLYTSPSPRDATLSRMPSSA